MASFHDTVDLERAFLKAVTSSVIMARTYLHQAREELFTSEQRQTIFAFSAKALDESNTVLNRGVFEYEIRARLDDAEATNFIGEWNLMEGVEDFDGPELVLAKLKEAEVGRKALGVSDGLLDLLGKGQITEAVAYLKREAMMIGGTKQDRPMVPLTDITTRLALIREKLAHPELYQGIKIGLPTFDIETGGLFPGELTLIAGITGLGKSTLCRTIAKGIVTLNGAKNVLHIANEEYLEQVQYKYDAIFTGIPYLDFKLAKIGDVELDRWQKHMEGPMREAGRGQVFVKEVAAFTDVSLIEQQYRILENRGIPIHVIIIDHLPHVKPIQMAWGENDERAKAAADCKELARSLRVSVVTPTQAATEVEKKQTAGKRAGKLDVYGSKGQVHIANTFVIITFKGTDDSQTDRPENKRDVFLFCDGKKNRDGAPFCFFAKHIVRSGEIVEINDPSLKPTKQAAKAVAAGIKEGEGTGKPAVVSTPPAGTQTPSPAAQESVSANQGLRAASVEFAEAIEGDSEVEPIPVSAKEVQDLEAALAEGQVQEPPIALTASEIEAARLVKAAESVPRSTLDRLRAKKIPF
jgi:replicative DNA helicase